MAAAEITISGLLYDKLARTTQNVALIGEATITGLHPGGGPVVPPVQPPWGGVDKPPVVEHPIWPPNIPGQGPIIPPSPIEPAPPDVEIPPPGSPPVVLPGNQPVAPIVPPAAIVVQYPGVGKVLVPLPAPAG